MTNLPFEMSVNTIQPERTKQTLTCTAILREIPKNRCVYQAVSDNKNVIAKVFSGKMSSQRRVSREWKGLKELESRKLNAPKPLFYGTTTAHRWVIVTQQIPDSATTLELYEKGDQRHLLNLIVKELAMLNSKGVFQKDIHLGNFLLQGERVFALDVGQMVFEQQPLSKNESLKQLAAVLCFLPGGNSIQKLCREYTSARKWQFKAKYETAVKKYIEIHLKKAIHRGLKKTLRTNKRCVRFRNKGYIGVFDRGFYEKSTLSHLIAKIDELMDNGTILKNGNTCYVSRINYGGLDLVVKRYNHKGFFHSLRTSLKGSRARRCWLHGHRLGMLGIPTPKPLAFIEQHKGLLIRQSYIITEYTAGRKLFEILRDKSTSRQKCQQVKHLVSELITNMHNNRITHGDMKHSNILLTDSRACITDLDGMKIHRPGRLFQLRRKKDLETLANITL